MFTRSIKLLFLSVLLSCNSEDASKIIYSSPEGGGVNGFSCPNGYALVNAYPSLGVTSDFCVMQYEASNIGNRPNSSSTLAPWTSVSTSQAKTLCQSLKSSSFLGVFDLISNREWMALAYQLEAHGDNWSSGVVDYFT